jgi:hypothetical protein
MFPFRRGGGKKRGKPQGGQPNQGGRRQGGQTGGGRRIPNSAAELLGTLQPTTKSLAQVLAGNTRASGQVVHARNIVTQAERLVDERAVDRLPPKQREEFLEQLARLKLTLADADDAADAEAAAEPAAPAAPAVSMDRLRELALSMASSGPAPGQPTDAAEAAEAGPDADGSTVGDSGAEATTEASEPEPGPEPEPELDDEAIEKATARKVARGKRGPTLRLKTVRRDAAEEDDAHAAEAEAAR